MIKVNLLRDQTVKARKKAAAPPISHAGIYLLGGFLLLAAALGVWWYYLYKEIAGLDAKREILRVEDQRLLALKKEITEFERIKQLRESRIQVIEKLKEAQTGPVQLLNHVIQSMPRDSSLWLTLLEQKGDRVQIVGYAQRSEVIPGFMTNLAAGNIFKSVDLEVVQEEKDASKFSLICTTPRKLPAE